MSSDITTFYDAGTTAHDARRDSAVCLCVEDDAQAAAIRAPLLAIASAFILLIQLIPIIDLLWDRQISACMVPASVVVAVVAGWRRTKPPWRTSASLIRVWCFGTQDQSLGWPPSRAAINEELRYQCIGNVRKRSEVVRGAVLGFDLVFHSVWAVGGADVAEPALLAAGHASCRFVG